MIWRMTWTDITGKIRSRLDITTKSNISWRKALRRLSRCASGRSPASEAIPDKTGDLLWKVKTAHLKDKRGQFLEVKIQMR
jgi:hypothetical protein